MYPAPRCTAAPTVALTLGILLAACDGESGAAASLGIPEASYLLESDRTHFRAGADVPPVLHVPRGAVVEVRLTDTGRGRIGPDSGSDDLWNVDPQPVLTGPIYVEGARPGDILAVTLLRVEPGDWGWAGVSPGAGLIDEITGPYLRTFTLDAGSGEATMGGARIPLRPFPGLLTVAPPDDVTLLPFAPWGHGGLLADPALGEGVTVYFPVGVDGALFSLGEPRAAQGVGQIAGAALAAPLRVVFQLDVIEGEWAIVEPQFESATHFGVTAAAPTLEEATRNAARYMVDHLTRGHGLPRAEAYLLTSLAGDLRVTRALPRGPAAVTLTLPKTVLEPR
jgi:acetamidase/formamidase